MSDAKKLVPQSIEVTLRRGAKRSSTVTAMPAAQIETKFRPRVERSARGVPADPILGSIQRLEACEDVCHLGLHA